MKHIFTSDKNLFHIVCTHKHTSKKQASCGENISALLSSKGNLYTAGSSEWGQLANGETGEYIISAGKLGYANCTKFLRRSVFVEADNNNESNKTDGNGRVKCVPLPNTNSIKLATVSCGRNHLIAIEAPSSEQSSASLYMGCSDYGLLRMPGSCHTGQ